jgi:hypothetical protein
MPSVDPQGEPAPDRGGAHTYTGAVRWEYSPELDHEPDPGEVVWTWVAFEEDDSIGKDRPVAVVGRAEDRRLVALMLSSQDHRGDRDWLSIGSGPWDREGRESWVRRDRFLAVEADAVRREGAILPRATYDAIVRGLTAAPAGPQGPTPTHPTGKSVTSPPRRGFLSRVRRMFGG